MLVIEGGIDPEYFLDKMQMYELSSLLKNIFKKNRESWEQARMISYVIAQSNSTKQLKPIDILKFSWDEKVPDNDISISNEDINRLREKSKQILNLINYGFSNKAAFKYKPI